MTKELWLKILEDALKKMPKNERSKVVEFYTEMIEDKIEGGESEGAVVDSLGNPHDVAEKILAENGIKIEESEKEQPVEIKQAEPKKRKIPLWLACVSGIVVVPVGIALIASWFSVYVSFIATFFALAVSVVACVVAIFASLIMAFTGFVPSGVALVGAAIAGTGVVMLLTVGFWFVCKYMNKATKWIFSKKARRGEQK